LTIVAVPCVNEVERSVHWVCALVRLRNWQTLVALAVCAGSKRLKPANTPASWLIVTVWPPIVTVPLRAGPLLAVAVTTIVPLPATVPLGTLRNDDVVEAVQAQLVSAVTLTVTVPPPLLALKLVPESVTVQPVGAVFWNAACENTTAVPLTTMLAERAAPVLAAMLYATVPFPVPDPPEVIDTKLALLAAVHAQLEAAVTGIVPVDAAAPTLVVVEPSVTAQVPEPDDDGVVSLFEHAAAASATAIIPTDASNSR